MSSIRSVSVHSARSRVLVLTTVVVAALVLLLAWHLVLGWSWLSGAVVLGIAGALVGYGYVMADSPSRPDAFM